MAKLIHKELSYRVIGAVFEVFNELGYGYQEKSYQKAISLELEKRGISYIREKPFKLNYLEENIGMYFVDFIIENKIILELKVANSYYSQDVKQVLGYLKASGLKLGILATITKEGIKYKRIIKANTNYSRLLA